MKTLIEISGALTAFFLLMRPCVNIVVRHYYEQQKRREREARKP